MTISAFLPFLLASYGIKSSHVPSVEAIDKAVAKNKVSEICLEPV